jgi:hypothetical protein
MPDWSVVDGAPGATQKNTPALSKKATSSTL